MDQVWTPSRWGREQLIANGLPAERIRVVPEGVDADRFAPQPAARPEDDHTFRMLCVGKWEKRKGVDDLVSAFCRAFSSGEDVELVLACHNPYLKDFDARQALDRLCGRIRRASACGLLATIGHWSSCTTGPTCLSCRPGRKAGACRSSRRWPAGFR